MNHYVAQQESAWQRCTITFPLEFHFSLPSFQLKVKRLLRSSNERMFCLSKEEVLSKPKCSVKALPGKNGMKLLKPRFIFGSGPSQIVFFFHKAGEASMLKLEKWESLLESHWKTCQVMMLFPFYFCLSCHKAGTFKTQKPSSCCDFPKCSSKYPCSSWHIK